MTTRGGAIEAIYDLVQGVCDLQQRAVDLYRPVVNAILSTDSRDAAHIERTLDGLLDFCGHGPVLGLYKALCRHYWSIDPEAAACYVNTYRELWDSDTAAASAGSSQLPD